MYERMAGQEVPGATTVAVEYFLAYGRSAVGLEPYCPIPKPAPATLATRPRRHASRTSPWLGRLAVFRCYDMNDIVVRALAAFEELRGRPLP